MKKGLRHRGVSRTRNRLSLPCHTPVKGTFTYTEEFPLLGPTKPHTLVHEPEI